MRAGLRTVFILSLGLTALRCGSTDDPEWDPGTGAVRILEPATGQALKLDDSVRIVVESDFSKFGGGVSVDYSPDSSKHWYLIESFSRKEGVSKDTLVWYAKETGDVAAGSKILLRAYDYDREYVMTTGFISFSP